MNVIRYMNYESLSAELGDKLFQEIKLNPEAAICFSTGYSPVQGYRRFVHKALEQKLDTSRMTVVKLDEWLDISETSKSTCECFLQKEIIKPLKISSNHYVSFQLRSANPHVECQRIDSILEKKPLDLMILGLGKNGHIGLIEPNERLTVDTCCVQLDEITQSHAMLTAESENTKRGITLGLKTVFAAKKVLLVVTGSGKMDVIKALLSMQVSTSIPASLLWLHPNATMLLDEMQI